MQRIFERGRGRKFPLFYFLYLIKKEDIEQVCKQFLTETQFVVNVEVNNFNDIVISIDDFNGLSIDECRRISRAIEEQFDREKEDFSLEVSSPGLLNPFRVKEQYIKNIGKKVEVICNDGEKIVAKLMSISDAALTLETTKMKRVDNKKVVETESVIIQRADIKTVKSVIDFK